MTPRVLLVTRATELTRLIAMHGTLGQARFFLRSRGQDEEPLREAHARQEEALALARRAIPDEWRSARVDRGELSRFVFEPSDLVVAIGQDGLVANVAKYATGQRVIGVNPDPARYEGALVRHAPKVVGPLLRAVVAERAVVEARTMVRARTDDGQTLDALNEVFVGHRSHQSARYRLEVFEREERHSSSGLIVSTGTGASGWARSIHRERAVDWTLPSPTEPTLSFFVREAWPSVHTQTELTAGLLSEGAVLGVRSEMNDGGVLFGDGIEDDRIELRFGAEVRITRAPQQLALVVDA